MHKLVFLGDAARAKLLKGIDLAGQVIASTLGPKGKNVMVERDYGYPLITNDGYRNIQEIVLEDPVENMGVQILREVAKKTNDKVGDGTTTAVVIAHKLIKLVAEKIGGGGLVSTSSDLMVFYREINEHCAMAVGELQKLAKSIKGKEDIIKVASVSLENPELGKIIGEMVDRIGKDGFILVEPSFDGEVNTDIVEGMKLNVGLAAHWMVTDTQKRETVFTDPVLLITNYKIDNPLFLQGIVNGLVGIGKRELVIVAPRFSKEALASVAQTDKQGKFAILALQAPSVSDDEFEDIAVYSGGVFVDQNKGGVIEGTSIENLGRADKIVAMEDCTYLLGGRGKKADIEKRIGKIKVELKNAKVEMFKKKMFWRIASLASGIGIIRVGARTDFERDYLKYKIDDAIYSTKAAMEEGVVEGGGLALKKVAKKLPKGILAEALTAPYLKIQENAGGALAIGKDIIDPVKVVRLALENACSAASIFVTTDSVVAFHRSNLESELRKIVEK